MTMLLTTPDSPTDWIRIFAARLARRRPDARAEDVIRTAIEQFRCSAALAPETAAEQLTASGASELIGAADFSAQPTD